MGASAVSASFSVDSRVAGFIFGGLTLHAAHHLRPLATRAELRQVHERLRTDAPPPELLGPSLPCAATPRPCASGACRRPGARSRSAWPGARGARPNTSGLVLQQRGLLPLGVREQELSNRGEDLLQRAREQGRAPVSACGRCCGGK